MSIVKLNYRGYKELEKDLEGLERATEYRLEGFGAIRWKDTTESVAERVFERFFVFEFLDGKKVGGFWVEPKDIFMFEEVVAQCESQFKIYYREKVLLVSKHLDLASLLK